MPKIVRNFVYFGLVGIYNNRVKAKMCAEYMCVGKRFLLDMLHHCKQRFMAQIQTSASMGIWEVKLETMTGRKTDKPTDRHEGS